MAKTKDTAEQLTMDEYLLSQMDKPVVLKDGSMAKAADGHVMTKQEAIATNLLNMAMKGDLKAVQYITQLQAMDRMKKSRGK